MILKKRWFDITSWHYSKTISILFSILVQISIFKNLFVFWAYAETVFDESWLNNFFPESFMIVLLNWFLICFSKFLLFEVENRNFIGLLKLKFYACAGWVNAETIFFIGDWVTEERILRSPESTPNDFLRMLSQRSNFETVYIDILMHAQPAQNEFHRWLSQRGTNFIADWVCREGFLFLPCNN